MNTLESVRIGFIGCGGNARGHMRRLGGLEGVQVVAVADVVAEAAEAAAQITGGRPYTDYRRMLDEERLDAVYVSIPVFAHGQIELDLIERNLPFFVEKPVALDMETARRIEAAVAKAGLLTCVGYQLRYLPHARYAREWLAGRKISMITGNYWCGSGRGTGWHVHMEKSGGQLVEQATHTLDLFRYFGGEVEEVFSYQANRVLTHTAAPDVYAVALRFASGAIGSLTTVWHGDPKDWSEANRVRLFYDEYRLAWSVREVTLSPADPAFTPPAEPGPSIDEVFVDAVRTGDRSGILTPYEEGVRSLAISLAANESARTGKPVRIADLG